MREGVSPSLVALPAGPWPTVLDFLSERLPNVSPQGWAERIATGQVLHEDARPATAATERCSERATELPVYLLFANHVGNAPSPAHLMASDDRTHCP